jgi:nucleoside-diphosphate-sugar epimerase
VAGGHEVVGLDNLLTGRRQNLAAAMGSPRFSFVEADVASPPRFGRRFDMIYHLASPASPPDYLRLPFETLRVGAHGTIAMLELARAMDARFLVTSTSEVYGDPEITPQSESYWGHVNPVGPRAVYDEAKRFTEAATMAARRTWGLDIRIARVFNTYGERMRPDDGRVVSNFITQAIAERPLTVYGDGSQTRSFCYVDDLVRGIMLLMTKGDHAPTNLGNPDEYRVLDLAHRVKQLTSSPSPIVHAPLPEDDPKQRRPDITRARSLLGWEPEVRLDDGLRRTIAHFRAELDLPPRVQEVTP